LQCFNLEPGLNNETIAALKVKIASMKKSDKICTLTQCALCIDEVSIKKNVSFDIEVIKL